MWSCNKRCHTTCLRQLAYVANHGTNISGAQNINLPSTYGGGASSDPEFATFGRTAATNQYFLGFSSNYQSLQAQLTKRMSHGLAFTSAFTWGKALGYISGDDGGLQFYINWRRNYAPLDFDRRLNFEQSFTYELPFGRGHRLLSSGVGDAVLGGWKVTGILSVLSGLPFTVTANAGTLNTPGTAQTASLTGGFRKLGGIGATHPWFDTTRLTQPSGCTGQSPCTNPGLGNTGRNQFRGPGYMQNNFSTSKGFHVYREVAAGDSLRRIPIHAIRLSSASRIWHAVLQRSELPHRTSVTGTLGQRPGQRKRYWWRTQSAGFDRDSASSAESLLNLCGRSTLS